MSSIFQRTYKGVVSLCGATLAVGGLAAFPTAALAQTPTQPSPPVTQPPAPAPAAPTAPATPAPTPPPPAITVNGLIDVYYLFQFNNPKDSRNPYSPNNSLLGSGDDIYDARYNTPTLSLAELNITRAVPAVGGFGFKTTIIAGDTADINHATFGSSVTTDESRFKNIQQLYVTYAGKNGAGIDFGKFYTPFGYEVTESNANYNYSRSTAYNLLPFYHAGFRAYTPNLKGFVLTGYVVNAMYNNTEEGVHDVNGDKGFIGQVNYTDPKGKFVAIENFGYSRDGNDSRPGDPSVKYTLSDTDLTFTPNAKSTFGLNYVYKFAKYDDSGLGDTYRAFGDAAYYRYQINPKDAFALRYSGIGISPEGGSYGSLYDITGTYEIKNSSNWLSRIEYRHDGANDNYFGAGDAFLGGGGDVSANGEATKKSQDTVSVSEVYTF